MFGNNLLLCCFFFLAVAQLCSGLLTPEVTPNEWVLEHQVTTEDEFDERVLEKVSTPVIVNFYKPRGCDTCISAMGAVVEAANQRPLFDLVIVNTENTALDPIYNRFGVHVVPQTLVFKDGAVQSRLVGDRFTTAGVLRVLDRII